MANRSKGETWPEAPDVEAFMRDGFIVVRQAFSRETAEACVEQLARELRRRSIDVRRRATWTKPVVRLACPRGPAFSQAGASPRLYATYDALLGHGAWRRRDGVGGTVPVRFPSACDPGDAAWHIDGSFDRGGHLRVNIYSCGRGLLTLFLFTDVGLHDAPTELIVGSHRDVPRILAPLGSTGLRFEALTPRIPPSTFERPRTLATGRAGDVFVCHPFLVHRATWPHRGDRPRMLAQPEVGRDVPFALDADGPVCSVERVIIDALASRPIEPSPRGRGTNEPAPDDR